MSYPLCRVQLQRRTAEDSSSGRIIRVEPIFMLDEQRGAQTDELQMFVQGRSNGIMR